jgi:hypothetical protein
MKMTVFWDVAACRLEQIGRSFRSAYCLDHQGPTVSIIALMMEAASTSETSINFYQTTWRNISEDSHLHTRRRENLKSYKMPNVKLGCTYSTYIFNTGL